MWMFQNIIAFFPFRFHFCVLDIKFLLFVRMCVIFPYSTIFTRTLKCTQSRKVLMKWVCDLLRMLLILWILKWTSTQEHHLICIAKRETFILSLFHLCVWFFFVAHYWAVKPIWWINNKPIYNSHHHYGTLRHCLLKNVRIWNLWKRKEKQKAKNT